jgi:hypothetical protein
MMVVRFSMNTESFITRTENSDKKNYQGTKRNVTFSVLKASGKIHKMCYLCFLTKRVCKNTSLTPTELRGILRLNLNREDYLYPRCRNVYPCAKTEFCMGEKLGL